MQGLYVDTHGVEAVKQKLREGYKVIFLPLYKTFLDFFVLQYVNLAHNIPSGFTFGNCEDTPRILLID